VSGHEYSAEFFDRHVAGAIGSARAIVPIVLEMVQPKSVVDVGCGIGAWLSVFRDHGIRDLTGIDGPYVERSHLMIPGESFLSRDLEQPISLPRRFDLVISLEVAEHLSPASAGDFVRSLTRLGPAILFSAAIPGQGGEHHVNEQWPDFWAAKFAEAGFVGIDCIRPRVWNAPGVEWWYAQNAFLYLERELLRQNARLQSEAAAPRAPFAPVIHPGQYKSVAWKADALALVEDLLDVVPCGSDICLVDDNQLSDRSLRAWRMRRLMTRDAVYFGPPASADAALQDLQAQKREGASFLVVAWTAFWWLEFYSPFGAYLRSTFAPVLENERVVVFDLRRELREVPAGAHHSSDHAPTDIS
jgi:SAM-dependent methyltransferase